MVLTIPSTTFSLTFRVLSSISPYLYDPSQPFGWFTHTRYLFVSPVRLIVPVIFKTHSYYVLSGSSGHHGGDVPSLDYYLFYQYFVPGENRYLYRLVTVLSIFIGLRPTCLNTVTPRSSLPVGPTLCIFQYSSTNYWERQVPPILLQRSCFQDKLTIVRSIVPTYVSSEFRQWRYFFSSKERVQTSQKPGSSITGRIV